MFGYSDRRDHVWVNLSFKIIVVFRVHPKGYNTMKHPTIKQKRMIEAILTQRYRVESPVEYGRIPPNDKRAGEVHDCRSGFTGSGVFRVHVG